MTFRSVYDARQACNQTGADIASIADSSVESSIFAQLAVSCNIVHIYKRSFDYLAVCHDVLLAGIQKLLTAIL